MCRHVQSKLQLSSKAAAGSTRQQARLTANEFISALGCSEHVQLALARFHQKDSKPCDVDTAITSIYASAFCM